MFGGSYVIWFILGIISVIIILIAIILLIYAIKKESSRFLIPHISAQVKRKINLDKIFKIIHIEESF